MNDVFGSTYLRGVVPDKIMENYNYGGSELDKNKLDKLHAESLIKTNGFTKFYNIGVHSDKHGIYTLKFITNGKPNLVIDKLAKLTESDILLTSTSLLFSKEKFIYAGKRYN